MGAPISLGQRRLAPGEMWFAPQGRVGWVKGSLDQFQSCLRSLTTRGLAFAEEQTIPV